MDTKIRINEIFPSIQGEGYYTGTPAIFVRFQGCHVGCKFCDTKGSWKTDMQFSTVAGVMDTIGHWLDKYPHINLVVITGGEPFEQPEALAHLIKRIMHTFPRLYIQVETSGGVQVPEGIDPFCIRLDKNDPLQYVLDNQKIICLSPKMAKPPQDLFYAIAHSIKLLVGPEGLITPKPLSEILKLWRSVSPHNHLFFQPIDFGTEALKREASMRAVELAMQYGARVSPQIHKYLGVK